jgi:Flp pilus assembly secretin CpaC
LNAEQTVAVVEFEEQSEEVEMAGRNSVRRMTGLSGVRATILIVMSAVLVVSCSAHQPQSGRRLKEKLGKMEQEGARALTESIAKEVIPPGMEQSRTDRSLAVLNPREPIWIQSGKSRVIQLRSRIDRVSIANPDLAGIVVLGPRTIQVNAKALPQEEAPPQEPAIRLGGAGLYLGKTLTREPRTAETTITIWGEEGIDAHTLVVANFIDEQVLLEVTVAELDRTAMEQYGFDFRIIQNDAIAAGFMGGGFPVQTLTTVPPQSGQPLLPLTIGSGAPTYAMIFPNEDFTAFLKVLETEGLATVLAQPKLLALSGQNAAFQVGGEIPIRISTAFTTDIEYKPFGTIVNFIPKVSEEGDITLTVTPEVSEPDFTKEVEGIPTFITRRASTSARLRNGQMLVIGGLLQTKTTEVVSGVPYLKDIPALGYLFSQRTYERDVTELMVVAKPSLVHPIPAGETVKLIPDHPFTREEARTKETDAPVTRPRIPGLP